MSMALSMNGASRAGARSSRAAALAGLLAIVASAVAGCGDAPVVGKQPMKRAYAVENNVDGLTVWTDTKARADVLIHIDSADDIDLFPQSRLDSIESAAKRIRRGDVNAVITISPFIERGGTFTLSTLSRLWGIWSSRCVMQFRRAVRLSSERTMCQGAYFVSVAFSMRSRARE